ncbi:MAG TPA: SUF system NifU family Fe-S cluster assembly protein [Fibrobacteria bacterium]|jgi:nitrogen fixation NifU-like protein|nr:SUF system NifU family Fe-S cluster assembly protein [Fibrobacteria bacterium]
MSAANELYQQVILDHNRNPRNYRPLPDATHVCHGHNPLCGDDITVYAKMGEGGKIEDVSFQGNGCAISKASASLMTQQLKGKPIEEARELFGEFHKMVKGNLNPETQPNHLGKLRLFEGVKEYSSRIKCATLSWHALMGALDRQEEATTE